MYNLGSTYGLAGGKAAAAEVQGQTSGFSKTEKIKQQVQNRKQQQDLHAIRRDAMMNDLEKSHMQLMAQKTQAKESGAFTPENMTYISEKMNQVEKQLQGYQGDSLNGIINQFLGSMTPSEEVSSINSNLTPEVRQKMGLKSDLRSLEPNSENDRRMMTDFLAKQDPFFSQLAPEQQKRRVDQAFAQGTRLNADGQVLDVNGLGIATGAAPKMTAEQKRVYERKMKGESLSSEVSKGKSGKGVERATSGVAPIPGVEGSGTAPEESVSAWSNEGTEVIGEAETEEQYRAGGSRSWRNKNPGNHKYGEFAKGQGAVGADKDGFAIYPDEATGRKAQGALLRGGSYKDKNLSEMISRYAPASDNNDEGAYAKAVASKTGIDPKKKMGDYTEEEMNRLTTAMQIHEGWKEGESTGTPPQSYVAAWNSETGNAGDVPFGQSNVADRQTVLNNLAGWSDSRTALQKDLAFIGDRLGPEATMNDVVGTYKDIKQSSYGKTYAFEQAIERNNTLVDEAVRNGDMTAEEGRVAKLQYESNMLTKQTSGAAQVREDADLAGIGSQQNIYENATVKGIVPKAVLDRAKQAEYGIKETDETKKLKTQLRDTSKIVETGTKLASEIEQLESSGKLNRGFLDQLKQVTLEYGEEGRMSPETLDKLYASAGVDTKLSMFAADYLRALSGTAASENERKATFQRLGAGFGIQPGVTVERIKAFNEVNADKVRIDAEKLARGGFSGSAMEGKIAIGDIQMGDQKQATVVQQESPKVKKAPDAPTATNQMDTTTIQNAKTVDRESVMLETPGTKFKNPQGKWVTNLGNGRIYVED